MQRQAQHWNAEPGTAKAGLALPGRAIQSHAGNSNAPQRTEKHPPPLAQTESCWSLPKRWRMQIDFVGSSGLSPTLMSESKIIVIVNRNFNNPLCLDTCKME